MMVSKQGGDNVMDQTIEIERPWQPNRPAMWRRLWGSRLVWAFAGVTLALTVVEVAIKQSESPADFAAQSVTGLSALAPARIVSPHYMNASLQTPLQEKEVIGGIAGPMIAQTAALTIVPENYDRAASSIDALVAAHGGYVQKLNSESRPDSSREVSITLRIPVKQMDGFLADLRNLGRVEEESRENEEVMDQYVDLDARLQNARAGEQRLIQLLATRTGKLEDVLDAERELTRVRGDIESMTAEYNLLLHRVEYATVELHLQEQYRAQFGSGAPAESLHNALVEGFRNLEAGAIAALTFVLAYGPSMMFWLAIFGGSTLLAWRFARRKIETTPR
jgi:hypothetical protein